MVGHIDDDGVVVFKPLDDGIHDGVVVKNGIVIVGQHAQFLFLQLRTLIVFGGEVTSVGRKPCAIIHMLPFQVKYNQVVLLVLRLQTVIVVEQSIVIAE